MTQRICIVFLLLIVIVNPRVNGSDDKAGIAPGTWQEAAMKRGLSEEEIAILQKDDILLTNQEYRQIYSAYSHPDISVFITSDSLLNAYHVLLEESIVQLEASQVSRLSETLKMILTDLELLRFSVQDQPELNAAAQRRARLVIGIAVRLFVWATLNWMPFWLRSRHGLNPRRESFCPNGWAHQAHPCL